MSLTVKVLGRSPLVGGGHTVTGAAVNQKEMVWGELTGDYVTTGLPFTVTDVGLKGTFDSLHLSAVTILGNTGAGVVEETTGINVFFNEADGKILMNTEVTAGDKTESTQTAYVINFLAIGDSARAPELT